MALTYKNLFRQVADLIDQGGQFGTITRLENQLSRDEIQPFALSTDRSEDALTLALIRRVIEILQVGLPSRIISGLNVTATDPETKTVNITAGQATSFGDVYTLDADITLDIPLDEAIPNNIYFIQLFQDTISIDKVIDPQRALIAKIMVPDPGVSDIVRDKNNGSDDAYIIQMKEVKFFGDAGGIFEENSLELMRDNIGDILADNIIGNIRLSENLKITNTQGTLELNSDSMKLFDEDDNLLSKFTQTGVFFFDNTGVEIAKFAGDETRIGNIVINPTAIQSGNYQVNSAGFRIRDNGDAEFNNIRLRGTLFTSTIAENIFINPGIQFIGDLTFNGDICLLVDKQLSFDCDEGEDTYIVYNSTSDYLEIWVDGSKRLEL